MQNLHLEYGPFNKNKPYVLIATDFSIRSYIEVKKHFALYSNHVNLIYIVYDETIKFLHDGIKQNDKQSLEKILYSMLAKNILMLLYSNTTVKKSPIHIIAKSTGACIAISILEQASAYGINLGEIWLQSIAPMDIFQKIKAYRHINLAWSKYDNRNPFENFDIMKERLTAAGYMVLGQIYGEQNNNWIHHYTNFAVRSILNKILTDEL